MLCTFWFYSGANTTAVISLLTVKYVIEAAASFSVTMQVAASLLEQAVNVLQPAIHCTFYIFNYEKP